MRKLCSVTLLSLAIGLMAGCNGQSPTSNKAEGGKAHLQQPVMDTSTPDRTVKSYWALKDWSMDVERAIFGEYRKSAQFNDVRKMIEQVNSKQIAESSLHIEQANQYSRDILQATVETDSRAVVLTQLKNITELPSDAVLSKYQTEAREKGERIKYVLEKDQVGWRIIEVWRWDEFSREFIKDRPSKPSYPIYVFGAW